MSVTEAIEVYGALMESVFADVKIFGRHSKFKVIKLEEAIKKIVTEQTSNADEHMMDMHEGQVCKTYMVENLQHTGMSYS